jgi:hypothetical protein
LLVALLADSRGESAANGKMTLPCAVDFQTGSDVRMAQ